MGNTQQDDIGFVFIHGAGLGAWIWDDVVSKLKYQYLAIDFPGRGKHSSIENRNYSLKSYVDLVLSDVDQFRPKKLIIVTHSIGGIVGLEVNRLRANRVIGFIAISASIPLKNKSFISSMPLLNGLIMRLMMNIAGTRPPDSVLRNGLCNDLDEEQTKCVITRFTPESKYLYTETVKENQLPANTLYVYLSGDKGFSVSLQKQMINNLHGVQVVSIDSGHLPMLSKPKELAEILNQFAQKTNM